MNGIFLFEMLRQMLRTIHRTVLSTGTTERHLQIRKITLYEPRYIMVHKRIQGLQESQYLAILLQKIDNRLIQAGEGLVLFVLTGVVGTTAVEHITASVTGRVRRDTALKREGVDRY